MGNPIAPPQPMDLVRTGVRACARGAEELFDEVMAALLSAPVRPLVRDLAAALEEQLTRRRAHGWQPAELRRAITRALGAQAAGYVAGGAAHLVPADDDAWVDLLVTIIRLLHTLEQLPDLPRVGPSPSVRRLDAPTRADSAPDDRLPAQVGALLADAASAPSDTDAEARTAMAQALLARHRVDVAARSGPGAPPVVGRRVRIDDPYAEAKATLLAGVCAANGAQAVWTKHAGASTVFGSSVDVDVVEALFASLLRQATGALGRAEAARDRFGRSRAPRFRRSFLDDFAQRTARHLRDTVDATFGADERHRRLRPVLAAQEAAVAAAVSEAVPDPAACTPTPLHDHERWVEATLFDAAIG